MAGYFPSSNYDPSNPSTWGDVKQYPQPSHQPIGAPPSALYGPIRGNYAQPPYIPDINPPRVHSFSPHPSTRTNVYVSGFPTEWTGANLRDLFKSFGTICEVKIITKKTPDLNRGVAFVHYSKNASAVQAVQELHENTPSGCTGQLTVRFANANRNVQPEFLRTMRVNVTRMRAQGWSLESALNLYVCQLPAGITEERLKQLFGPFGIITKMRIMSTNEKGAAAFVHYETPEEAVKAVAAMDESQPDKESGPITVRFANVNKTKIPEWFSVEHIKNMQTTANVYVSQIPLDWTEKNLSDRFAGCGPINDVKLLSRKDASGGVAFVHFERAISACKAVAQLNDTCPESEKSNKLLVTFARMDSLTFDKLMKNTFPGAIAGPNLRHGFAPIPPVVYQQEYPAAPYAQMQQAPNSAVPGMGRPPRAT